MAVAAGASGAEDPAAAAFLDLEDFLDVEALVVLEAAPAEASADSVFLLFLDLLPLEVSAEAAAELSAASDFFDLEGFLVVELSAAAVELSAASDFLDFDDFFVVDVSAAAASVAPAFLLLADFLVAEVSVEEASSAVSAFFFFDFDLEALVSLWSAELWAAWLAAELRTTALAPSSNKADSNARTLLRVRFILNGSFPAAVDLPCRYTQDACFGRVTGEKTGQLAAAVPGGMAGIMFEKVAEVKRRFAGSAATARRAKAWRWIS